MVLVSTVPRPSLGALGGYVRAGDGGDKTGHMRSPHKVLGTIGPRQTRPSVDWTVQHEHAPHHGDDSHAADGRPQPRMSIVLPELVAPSSFGRPSRESFVGHRRVPHPQRDGGLQRLPDAPHRPSDAGLSSLRRLSSDQQQQSNRRASRGGDAARQARASLVAVAETVDEECTESSGDGIGIEGHGMNVGHTHAAAQHAHAHAEGAASSDGDAERARRASVVVLSLESMADVRNRKLEELKRRKGGFPKPPFAKAEPVGVPGVPVGTNVASPASRTRRSIAYAVGALPSRQFAEAIPPSQERRLHEAHHSGATPPPAPHRVSVFHRGSDARASIFEFGPRNVRRSIFDYPIGEMPLLKKSRFGPAEPNPVTEVRIQKMKEAEARRRAREREALDAEVKRRAKAKGKSGRKEDGGEDEEGESDDPDARIRARMRGCINDAEKSRIVNEKQLHRFGLLFRALDAGGKGALSLDELRKGLEHVTVEEDGVTEQLPEEMGDKVAYILKVLDLESNDHVTEKEFVVAMALCERMNDVEENGPDGRPLKANFDFQRLEREIRHYRQLFLLCDMDRSGYLSVEELQVLLASSGQVTTLAEAQAILRHMDTDNNGVVDFVEFLAYIPFFVDIHGRLVGSV
eukprot:Opistho-1_new@7605